MADLATGGAPHGADRSRVPLSALLSQVLVAFTIEFDNEFEHQMPHRTTRHGATPGADQAPWLVSMVMWSNCMQFVPQDGIPAGALAQQARITDESLRMVLTRMGEWWGYLVVDAALTGAHAPLPRAARRVRPTRSGQHAQRVWAPLTGLIEDRWRARLGTDPIDQLRGCLRAMESRFAVALPDYLPVGSPRLEPQVSATRAGGAPSEPTLPALLSKVLFAFALDVERETDLSVALSANSVRVLTEDGVQIRHLPALTGVAKMALDNALKHLQERRYILVEPDPSGGRFKVARLTPKGRQAQDRYWQVVTASEQRWAARFGEEALRSLRGTLERLVGASTPHQSPLFRGLEPYPDGWRAAVPRPTMLPHYPVVSHRGGFPDGS